MPFLARIVTFFLIPGLIVSPVQAIAFVHLQPEIGSQTNSTIPFTRQALALPLVTQEPGGPAKVIKLLSAA